MWEKIKTALHVTVVLGLFLVAVSLEWKSEMVPSKNETELLSVKPGDKLNVERFEKIRVTDEWINGKKYTMTLRNLKKFIITVDENEKIISIWKE